MNNKQLKKLTKTELFEILLEQSKRNEELEEELGIQEKDSLSPKLEQLVKEKAYKHRYRQTLASTVRVLITVAAITVLIATLWLPVLRIYGESMSPTLNAKDIVVSLKASKFETGDVVAFYYNNKILVKRVIASAGDYVNILPDGTVTVNGVELVEPYLEEKAFGDCDIELPYQVPESKIFVMGDNRSVSLDSRNTAVGCVAEEQIVGRLVFRIWPFENAEKIPRYQK